MMSRMTMMMDFYVIMTLFAIVSLLIIGLLFGFVASPSALNKFFDFVLCSKEDGKKENSAYFIVISKYGSVGRSSGLLYARPINTPHLRSS